MSKIRITKLRLVLSIAGAVWGVNSFFHALMREGGTVHAPDVIIELPVWLLNITVGAMLRLLRPPQGTPYSLVLLMVTLLIIFTALTGAAIGFVNAVVIEKLASLFHRISSGRELRLTLASLGALVAVAAVLLGLTWAESTGARGRENCSIRYPDPQLIQGPGPRVVASRPEGFSWNLGVRCWLKLNDGSERVIILKPWWDPSPIRADRFLRMTLMAVSVTSVALIGAGLGLMAAAAIKKLAALLAPD